MSLFRITFLHLAVRLTSLFLLPRFFMRSDDPLLYQSLVESDLQGALPMEPPSILYPPAALILFVLPYPAGALVGYRVAFAGLMLLVDLATTLLVAAACR